MISALAGKRIVNTRAIHQAGALDSLLRERGAEPIAYPCIAILPPEDTTALDAALQAASNGTFDWLVLTSANTVLILAQRLQALHLSLTDVPNLRAAAVGPATAEAAFDLLGLKVDTLPDEYTAEALAQMVADVPGIRVLLPQSAIARPTLAETLRAAGANVTVVAAYRTVRGSGGVNLAAMLTRGEVDAITFTSSSTVEYFLQRLGRNIAAGLGEVCIACIGPQTAHTAQSYGLRASVVPEVHTLEGLVDGLEAYFAAERLRSG